MFETHFAPLGFTQRWARHCWAECAAGSRALLDRARVVGPRTLLCRANSGLLLLLLGCYCVSSQLGRINSTQPELAPSATILQNQNHPINHQVANTPPTASPPRQKTFVEVRKEPINNPKYHAEPNDTYVNNEGAPQAIDNIVVPIYDVNDCNMHKTNLDTHVVDNVTMHVNDATVCYVHNVDLDIHDVDNSVVHINDVNTGDAHNVEKHVSNNIADHINDALACKMNEVGDISVVGHCEGVAMEASL
ncbi:hypothetical protein Salat_2958300 [Sesamum alatum]|uniref:Uncharacterized protein n=1 Tax=Sesamum alatum TaxID=300844 RepID=A0AAE1XJR9_9LAMI|nr:hypothetical protein Salat_2958300 [Sesamum alatum]